MCWLPKVKQDHWGGSWTHDNSRRLVLRTKWQEVLVEDWPYQSLLADTCGTGRQAQDSFLTPIGQYEFTKIPFGMVNSGSSLVRGLRKILEGMPGAGSYIDDIVIYSDSWEDHLRTLKELFGRLRKEMITARPTKCLLGASRM